MTQFDSMDADFRRPVLLSFLTIAVGMLSWHTVAEFFQGIRVLAYAQLALSIYSAAVLYLVYARPYSVVLAMVTVIPIMLLLLAAMAHTQTPPKVFIWVLIFPVITYSLLGKRFGFFITLSSSIMAFFAYAYRFSDDEFMFGFLMMSDSIICLIVIWLVVHLFERYREITAEKLRKMATTDELTGLYNRRQMKQVYEHLAVAAERQQQSVGVLVVDIDHFKQVNDTWGHEAGDAVLVHVSHVIRGSLRRSDWAFRTGGEEFCLLLTVDDKDGATQTAELLRNRIENSPCYFGNLVIPITASIGVATYPNDGSELDKVMHVSDKMMYLAKQAGRNRVVSDDAV